MDKSYHKLQIWGKEQRETARGRKSDRGDNLEGRGLKFTSRGLHVIALDYKARAVVISGESKNKTTKLCD